MWGLYTVLCVCVVSGGCARRVCVCVRACVRLCGGFCTPCERGGACTRVRVWGCVHAV